MPSQRVYFENDQGTRLAGIIDLPDSEPLAFALFTHCFTCTKDLKAIVRISRGLAKQGIGVLRFDFTGLGDSHGDFSNSNFESNLADIQSAAHWLSNEHHSPEILMGLSLGGAAMMASTKTIETTKAIVTLAAPSCTFHLAEFLAKTNPAIESEGSGEVVIGGRTHLIRPQLLDSLRAFDLKSKIESISVPHMIIHSPEDETLDFRHAEDIFQMTGGPRTMLTLSGANHLMVNQPDDVGYVSQMIGTWAKRYLYS